MTGLHDAVVTIVDGDGWSSTQAVYVGDDVAPETFIGEAIDAFRRSRPGELRLPLTIHYTERR